MKLLLDQNLSRRLTQLLSPFFEEIVHVGDIGFDESSDRDIWLFAKEHGFVILSKDGDFADMALIYGAPPKIIRLRIGNSPWQTAAEVISKNAMVVQSFLDDPESSLLVLNDFQPT
ncbi:MAG: DUF5615 family PIN-like protein [Fimbriimonas sp.]|nr:DUF5615 family PIN-like protein [Fimbriimonas sp.]